MMSLLTKLSASIICLSLVYLINLYKPDPLCHFCFGLILFVDLSTSSWKKTIGISQIKDRQKIRVRNGGQKRERWKEISLCSWQRRFVTCRTAVFIGVFLESRDCAKMEIRQKSPKDLNGETDKAEKLIFPIHYYGNCPTCLFWESKTTCSGGLAIWSARSFPDGPPCNGGRPFA